jgi:hypothetical protein
VKNFQEVPRMGRWKAVMRLSFTLAASETNGSAPTAKKAFEIRKN